MFGREGELGSVGDSGRGVVAKVRVEEVAAGESATRVAECSSLVSTGEERSTFEENVEDDKETCTCSVTKIIIISGMRTEKVRNKRLWIKTKPPFSLHLLMMMTFLYCNQRLSLLLN